MYVSTLKRNRNATLFQWKIHWVLFKVLDRDNEPSSFHEMLTNSTKRRMKWLPIKKKRILVGNTSVSAYVNVKYFLRFRCFLTLELILIFVFCKHLCLRYDVLHLVPFYMKVFRQNKNFLLSSLSINKTTARKIFKKSFD